MVPGGLVRPVIVMLVPGGVVSPAIITGIFSSRWY